MKHSPNCAFAVMDYSGYNYQQQPQQHSYGYNPSQIQIHPYDQSYAYQQYYTYNPQYAYFPNAYQAQFQFQPESTLLHPLGVYLIAPESTLLHPPGVYPIAPEPTLLHPPGIYPVAPEPTLFHPPGVYPVAPEPASVNFSLILPILDYVVIIISIYSSFCLLVYL